MQGIEKRFSNEELQRSSEGRLPQNLHVGKLIEEQENERDKSHARSDVSRHKERKGRIEDDSKKDKITECNRSKDDRNISKYGSNAERKKSRREKVKDEETTETQNRSKRDKSKLQRTDRDKNVDRPESEENISRNENQQNITNEKCIKQSDNWKGETSTCYKSTKERMNRQDAKGNELKEGPYKTDNLQKLKSNKGKNITHKTEDSTKRQDLLHSEVRHQKHLVKGRNKKGDEKEQHSDKQKKHRKTNMHESFRKSLTDMKYTAPDLNAPEVVNLKLITKDKMSTKENMYSGVRKTEKGKHEQNTQDGRNHVFQKSGVKAQSRTSKQKTVSSIGTSDLLSGAPRLRQLLTLSPERHKGQIWAPLNLPQEPSFRNKTEAIISSDGNQKNTVKQGNKNIEHNYVQGKFKQNLTHHKQECIKGSRTLKDKQNSEWETKRLAMLFGSRLKTSTVCSVSYNNHNYIDEMESQDTDVHKRSFNKRALSLLGNSLKEGKEDLKTEYFKINMNDNLICGIQGPDEFINEKARFKDTVPVVRRLGKRKLQVIHVNSDESEEKTFQKWQTYGKSKPKLSTLTRKLVKVESGLNFAHKRKDKTPYLDKSFITPWNSDTFINTPSSSRSSKTPPDPTLERLLEDPGGSQEGLEQQNTSDHTPDLSQSFENHEVLKKNDNSVLSHTSENESYIKGVGLSSNSITDQLQLFRSNFDNVKDYSFSITSEDKTCISESHQILKECHVATDQRKDKICTYMEDTSQASNYSTCFENATYLCTNSSQSPIKTMDKSSHIKQHGQIKTKLNVTESQKSLSKKSVQGTDVQNNLWNDISVPLATSFETDNNNSFRLNVCSTEKDIPHIPTTGRETPFTDIFNVHPVQVISRNVSSESLDNWTPRLQAQMNKSAVSQDPSLKKHPSQALRADIMSSCTSVSEGLQTSVNELIPTHIPCKEVVALQVSHSEIANKSNNTFFSEISYEENSNGQSSQSLSAQDSVQPTYQFGDFPQLMYTVKPAPPTNISSIVSQEHKEEIPKMFMPQEGMQNSACSWLHSSEKGNVEYVTPTACGAEVNILKGNFYSNFFQDSINNFDKKSNSMELEEHMITRREPFGYLEMPLVHNHSTVNYDHILRERVVGDPNDHEVSKEYKAQNYIYDEEKEENVEKNIYIKSRNIENTECNKEGSHASGRAVLERSNDKIAHNTGNKSVHDEITEHPTSVSVMTKQNENRSLYCIEESPQKLSSGDKVCMKYQRNGKDGGETLIRVGDLSGGAKDKESLNGMNQKVYYETPAECSYGEIKQYKDLTVDMALGDTNQAGNRESNRNSPSSSRG